MALFKVAYKASTREIQIMPNATATPAGFVSWGTFNHDDDANDEAHWHGNHAVYKHVQALAYKAGEQNMQNKTIAYLGTNINPPA